MGGTVPPPVAGPAVPAAPAPTAPAAPAVATEVTVLTLPERLQGLTRAVVLTGTVAGDTPDGLTRVRTQAGEILLDTPTPLPTDKPVTLQITPGQTSAQGAKVLLLLTAGTTAAPSAPGTPAAPQAGAGQGPAVILPNPTIPSATPTATAGAPTAQPLPPLVPGSIVPALVIAAAPKPPAPRGTAPTLPGQAAPPPTPPVTTPTPSGAAPSATAGATPPPLAAAPTTAGAAPQPATQPAPSPGASPPMGKPMLDTPVQLGGDAAHPGAEPPPSAPATPKPTAPDPQPAPEPDLPQGGTVALKILTITPPPDQPQSHPQGMPPEGTPPKSSNLPGNPPADGESTKAPPSPAGLDDMPDAPDGATPDEPVLRGTVAGTTAQGQPILATRKGMLALNVQANLPQGATVTAALTDPGQALRAAAPAATPPGPLTERDWPAMRQILATLAGVDRAAAQSLLATAMPQPNRKLTAALSFLLSAIRGGDARGWLGDEAAAALDRAGRGDLVQQLDREFKSLQQQAADPLPGDWRPFVLPMFDANGPLPIRLHIHPIKGDEEEDGGRKGKRDGKGSRFLLDLELSRLGPLQLDGLVQPNRFDLILRSHTALAPELRLDLIQIFADSIRAVGYVGGLSFQSGAKCWVKLTRAGGAGGQSYTA
ncbi:hypothetical protein [Azospirillum rugosum]|uniref:Hook-length control protein FliK n=1 Tax=Azospirillum rugosum TaxID=416170 RepID=A0ABS4SG03_9PROT|nr:hypothetical protein [Azospirillum rugosum]MBP2290365.1 hypothetical protein [Azospirillum rugosum]MDQ0527841.1 hypothetical protein [Azospirillum rugosum]